MTLTSSFAPALLGAFGFWLQVSLGCLGITLIHDVTGGRWGFVIKPFLRWAIASLFLLAPVFVLVALLSPSIYSWPTEHASSWRLFFLLRGLIYFSIWIGLARGFRKRQCKNKSTRAWSGMSLLVLLFSVSFAAMDWFMTVDAHWGSTGFGVIFIAGALCSGFAIATFASEGEKVPVALRIDLGNLILMAVMLWAYVDFMQYLVIWSGQLPKEISWFQARSEGGWAFVIAAAALSGFFIPFLALLFRSIKKQTRFLRLIGFSVLLSRFLENAILVSPAQRSRLFVSLSTSAVACLLIGLAWLVIMRRGARGHRSEATEKGATP